MRLSKKQEQMLYEWCINEGVNIEYGKLSLCDLKNFNYSQISFNRRYQVHCEDKNCPWSMIYEQLSPAVCKFVELKKQVKRVK